MSADGPRCSCVCHVGIHGAWQAHACDCPDCPSQLGEADSPSSASEGRNVMTMAEIRQTINEYVEGARLSGEAPTFDGLDQEFENRLIYPPSNPKRDSRQ